MSAVAPLRSRDEENGQPAPYPSLAVRARNGRVADYPGFTRAWHLESACRMRHFVYGLFPKQAGNLCKRLRFKWYGARKSFYLACHLRKGTRVNQWRSYRERAKHTARRLLRISDNDSDGLIYGLPDLRLQGR